MPTLRFKVAAVPVAQPRPQPVKIGNHARMGNVPKSHPVHDFKASVRAGFAKHYQGTMPINEPLMVHLIFVMPRPQSMIWKTKPMPRVPYAAKKNDWDNLGKSVCDALNKFAYTDDGLIWRCTVERWVASGDEMPHVDVTMRWGSDDQMLVKFVPMIETMDADFPGVREPDQPIDDKVF